MKKLLIIACMLLAIVLPAVAETDLSLLIGSWVNPQYDAERQSSRFEYKSDGTYSLYPTTYATKPSNVYTFTVEEEWKDSEGVQWYKIVFTVIPPDWRFWYYLIRISPDGMIYEEDLIRAHLREFPSSIDPESYFYAIYKRE